MVCLVKAKESVTRRYPQFGVFPDEVHDVGIPYVMDGLRDGFTDNLVILYSQTVKTTLNCCPHRTVVVHVADVDVEFVTRITVGNHLPDVTVFIHLYIIYIGTRDEPNTVFRVAVYGHGLLRQCLVNQTVAFWFPVVHGMQVDDIGPFLVSHP